MNRLIQDLTHHVARFNCFKAMYPTSTPALSVLFDPAPTRMEAMIYDPVVCLVLQGHKETHIGDKCISFGAGDSLIVSHSVPVVAAVTEATRQRPYVALVLSIDLDAVRALYDEVGTISKPKPTADTLAAASTDPRLIDALSRLYYASEDPADAKALVPLYLREVYFRLLQADHGGMLRQMLWRESNESRVGRVIARLRRDYAKPMSVAELASDANMSVSGFYERFKSLTARSPLQFQKDLRLTEARRLLTREGQNVSTTAFTVGYESPTQFSREYSRKFGVSPRADMSKHLAA